MSLPNSIRFKKEAARCETATKIASFLESYVPAHLYDFALPDLLYFRCEKALLPISHEIEALKTDSDELEEVLNRYDLDEALEAHFNAIDERFRQLEIKYQSLLNTRRYLQDGY